MKDCRIIKAVRFKKVQENRKESMHFGGTWLMQAMIHVPCLSSILSR